MVLCARDLTKGASPQQGQRRRPVCPVWRVIVTGRENYPRWKAPGSSSRRALFADVRLARCLFRKTPLRWILIGSNAARLSRALCARPVTERCSRFVEPGLSRQFFWRNPRLREPRPARTSFFLTEEQSRAARSFAFALRRGQSQTFGLRGNVIW